MGQEFKLLQGAYTWTPVLSMPSFMLKYQVFMLKHCSPHACWEGQSLGVSSHDDPHPSPDLSSSYLYPVLLSQS